jgi:hypothetical protein
MEDAKDANHRVYKLESAKRTINSRKLCWAIYEARN